MAPPTKQAVINTTHFYDTANPDAIIPLSPLEDAERRLEICNARGARRKFRLAQTIKRSGEHEYPYGHALYLDVDSDPVLPMYAIVQYHPTEWHIEVRHDKGGEVVAYPFQTKAGALKFQSLVTGYDVVACFEGVHVAVVHKPDKGRLKIFDKFKPMGEFEEMAQIQLWKRRSPYSTSGLPLRQSVASDPRRTTTHHPHGAAGDAISLQTDPVTKQDVYLSEALPAPALVAFMMGRDGRATMLKLDISELQVRITGNLLHLSIPSQSFPVTRVSVRQDELAAWDICRLGTLASQREEDLLDCTYITLTLSRSGSVAALHNRILNLQLDHGQTEQARIEARRTALDNRRPSLLTPPESPESRSDRAHSFVGIPSLRSFPSLDVDAVLNRTVARAELGGSAVMPAQLDGTPIVPGRSNGTPVTTSSEEFSTHGMRHTGDPYI